MDLCSYFIPNTGLFGSYPTQASAEELEANGVRLYVDLTTCRDNLVPFTTCYPVEKFPIKDNSIPECRYEFAKFILKINNLISKLGKHSTNSVGMGSEKIYIFCRGGHGRSGLLVACLLAYRFGLSAKDALSLTNEAHKRRKIMNEKWREIGSPQSNIQKKFVCQFFGEIKIYKDSFAPLAGASFAPPSTEGVARFSGASFENRENYERKLREAPRGVAEQPLPMSSRRLTEQSFDTSRTEREDDGGFRFPRSRFPSPFSCLSSLSNYPFSTSLASFKSLEAAMQAYKDPKNKAYVDLICRQESAYYARRIGNNLYGFDFIPLVTTEADSSKNSSSPYSSEGTTKLNIATKKEFLKRLFVLQMKENPSIRDCLLSTGFSRIVDYSNDDPDFSVLGKNLYGIVLEEIRMSFYLMN
jgi:hypothetical protein